MQDSHDHGRLISDIVQSILKAAEDQRNAKTKILLSSKFTTKLYYVLFQDYGRKNLQLKKSPEGLLNCIMMCLIRILNFQVGDWESNTLTVHGQTHLWGLPQTLRSIERKLYCCSSFVSCAYECSSLVRFQELQEKELLLFVFMSDNPRHRLETIAQVLQRQRK